MIRCRWFTQCKNKADKQAEHPTLGWVNICDDHIAWLGPNPSPTQFVPPLYAAVFDRYSKSGLAGVAELPEGYPFS